MFSVCYNETGCRDVLAGSFPTAGNLVVARLLLMHIWASLIIYQYKGHFKYKTYILVRLYYMNAGERLRLWRKQHNISAGELAKRIGMSSSGVTSFERGEAAMSHKYLAALNENFGISADWLLTGSYRDLTMEEKELFEIFSQLDKSQQEHLVRIAKTFLKEE